MADLLEPPRILRSLRGRGHPRKRPPGGPVLQHQHRHQLRNRGSLLAGLRVRIPQRVPRTDRRARSHHHRRRESGRRPVPPRVRVRRPDHLHPGLPVRVLAVLRSHVPYRCPVPLVPARHTVHHPGLRLPDQIQHPEHQPLPPTPTRSCSRGCAWVTTCSSSGSGYWQ